MCPYSFLWPKYYFPVWISHVLYAHLSVGGHLLPPEPLGPGSALGPSSSSQIPLAKPLCCQVGLPSSFACFFVHSSIPSNMFVKYFVPIQELLSGKVNLTGLPCHHPKPELSLTLSAVFVVVALGRVALVLRCASMSPDWRKAPAWRS